MDAASKLPIENIVREKTIEELVNENERCKAAVIGLEDLEEIIDENDFFEDCYEEMVDFNENIASKD